MRHKINFQLLTLVLASLLLAAHPADEVYPTPLSVHFWALASTLDGDPLPADAVVRAYDPTGVLAGCYDPTGTLTGCQNDPGPSGGYKMPVYGDDHGPTSEVDEGADPGDRIAFTVNGYQAVPVGPDPPVWTQSGDQAHVELRACTLAGDFDCDCRVDAADIQQVAARWGIVRGQEGYYPPYDPDGGGIDVGDIQRVAMNWRNSCL